MCVFSDIYTNKNNKLKAQDWWSRQAPRLRAPPTNNNWLKLVKNHFIFSTQQNLLNKSTFLTYYKSSKIAFSETGKGEVEIMG